MSKELKMKIIITTLATLLVMSLGLLTYGVIRVLDRNMDQSSIKDNSIGAVEKEWKMEVSNMLPGDSITKYYEVELKQTDNVVLCFRADIVNSTNSLENALDIKVENRDTSKVVCNGKLADVAGQTYEEEILKENNEDEKQMYKITVSMDTSVGNEYQKSSLTMNFEWALRTVETEGGK